MSKPFLFPSRKWVFLKKKIETKMETKMTHLVFLFLGFELLSLQLKILNVDKRASKWRYKQRDSK